MVQIHLRSQEDDLLLGLLGLIGEAARQDAEDVRRDIG